MRLIADDDVGIEGVLLLGIRRQGIDGDESVTDIADNGVLHVVVRDTQAALCIFLDRHTEAIDVIFQEVESFERLLERTPDLIDLGSGPAFIQGQRPSQRGGERGLDVFSRDKIKRFFEPPFVCPLEVKPHDVEADELVVGQQVERRAAQRARVQELTLLVAERRLDDGDDLAGRLRPEIPSAGCQIVEITPACQDDPFARDDLPAEHFVDVGVDVALVFCCVLDSVVVRIVKQLLDLRPVRAHGLLAAGLIQAGRRQSQLVAQARDRRTKILNDRPVRVLRCVLAASLVGQSCDHQAARLFPSLLRATELALCLGQLLDRRLKNLVVSADGLHVGANHVLSGHC